MANQRVSQLSGTVTTPSDADLLLIENAATHKKITFANLIKYFVKSNVSETITVAWAFETQVISEDGFLVKNPNNLNASVALNWLSDNPRLRVGGTGAGASGIFRIQSSGDIDRVTIDNSGNGVWTGTSSATSFIEGGTALSSKYEPADTAIVKSDEAETITSNWVMANIDILNLNITSVSLGEVFLKVDDGAGSDVLKISRETGNVIKFQPFSSGTFQFTRATVFDSTVSSTSFIEGGTALSAKYHPLIATPNSAFNKNFGTTGTTVAYGNHTHSGFTQDSANEVISGAWAFTGIAEFGVAPQFTAASGVPFTVAATAQTMVTNLNAEMLGGSTKSAFSLTSHSHTIYPSKTGTESMTGAWTFGASGTVTFDTVPSFDNPVLPFTVHSNANLVTDLNSEFLGGYAESAFVRLSDSTPTTGFLFVQANEATNPAIRARQDGAGYLQDWYDGASQRAYMTKAGLMVSDDFKGLSDERLKTNIERVDANDLYDKVIKISKLISHYERIDKDNEEETGFVAQELNEVAPEFVHVPEDKDEMWAVGYGKMVTPLYAAIASIDERLERIEKKLGL